MNLREVMIEYILFAFSEEELMQKFQDTEEDFKLFVSLNEDMFERLANSSNTNTIFPTQMGLGKAALPLRFVKWLQQNLYDRFNIESTIEKNLNSQYDGYGLSLKSVSTKVTYKNTVTAREYFTEIFPEGLFNILEANPTMKSMPIFQYMQFQTDEKTGKDRYFYIIKRSISGSKFYFKIICYNIGNIRCSYS